MLGPNPSSVTSREKGGVQEMLNNVAFFEMLKSLTADSSPKFKWTSIAVIIQGMILCKDSHDILGMYIANSYIIMKHLPIMLQFQCMKGSQVFLYYSSSK